MSRIHSVVSAFFASWFALVFVHDGNAAGVILSEWMKIIAGAVAIGVVVGEGAAYAYRHWDDD